MKPAYLFSGDDDERISTTVTRLRARAEREGGPGALEVFEAGGSGPDAEALIASIPAMSLTAERRYLLADGVERWKAAQVKPMVEALADLPPDVTVVLIAHGKTPANLAKAVEKAGGETRAFESPKERELPALLVKGAAKRGFALDQRAARFLVSRMGRSTARLGNELDRLALWAGQDGTVAVEDLAGMVADDSEEVAWSLTDAIVERRSADALAAAERLVGQGESLSGLIYAVAARLRNAVMALEGLEAGRPPREVEASLPMHPYAAKLLVRGVRNTTLAELREATAIFADLEYWTRGGSDYEPEVALTLAVRRASGATKAAA